MDINLHSDGCSILIEYLTTKEAETSLERRKRYLSDLFKEPDFSKWVDAYEPMVPGVRSHLFEMMLELDNPPREEGALGLLEILRRGFLEAREEGYEKMMERLDLGKTIPKDDIEELVNRYLPDDTPLDIDIYLTIDNFNQGMIRETSVFTSILRMDPGKINVRGLAHEIHHAGVMYWFKKNEKWNRWISEGPGPRRIGAELLIYLVGEGIANRLITPSSVSFIEGPRNERESRWNERVNMLEESYPSLLATIEDIQLKALQGNMDESQRLYKELSINASGIGLPTGHFTSARMVAEILREHDESKIIELIKDPWKFFDVYNGLKMKSYRFPPEIVELYTGL